MVGLSFDPADNGVVCGAIPQEIGKLCSLEVLAIQDAALIGLVPSSIYNISSLKWLFLYENNLSGILPKETCLHVPKLQVLDLHDNKFTGTIPQGIGNCTSLSMLYLNGNNLTGVIPQEIGHLGNLERLVLAFNVLRGPIPALIFNNSALQIISLADNFLSGKIPSIIGQRQPNLEQLILPRNNLSGMIPNSISNASKLTTLDLTSNAFTGSIPNKLGNLKQLQLLGFGQNNLVNEHPSAELSFLTSLTNCRHLRIFWITNNPLEGILPVSIGNFSDSLKIVDMHGCKIRGKIPDEIGNLSNLAFLNLRRNEVTGVIPTTVSGLLKLQGLSLIDNKLQGCIPNDICGLKDVGYLGLSKNRLYCSVLPCLGNITSLRYLLLDDNELTSSIPAILWSLKDLLKLNLSSNFISGHLSPKIGGLKVATSIDLSMNQLSGNIPSTMGNLQNLINFSIAHNGFQGPIETFGKLVSLESLDLSRNHLTGVIPNSLEALLYLKYFNVSFNGLSGEIPTRGCFANFTNQSFMSNEALCGAPRLGVPSCHTKTLYLTRRRRVLLAVYISVVIALIVLALIFTFVLVRRRKINRIPAQTEPLPGITHGRITNEELFRATDGFSDSNLLGKGSFGSVYKGKFRDGTLLAIKVFNMQLEDAFKSFHTECEVLRSIRHRNLTKVISSCSNLDFKALALEFMPNGSLERWLYSHNYFLDMLQRLSIMIDVACALDYLHQGYSTTVVHCDLKPSNVLLDEDMVGHVSDFGIAKLLGAGDSIAQTKTLGTFGYMAPEIGLEGLVSTRGDIYSYGILVMETFTRRKPIDEMFAGDLSLKQWVKDSLPDGIIQVIDANLLRPEEEHFAEKAHCVSSIMELALNCSAESPAERINMKDVAAALKKIRQQFLARTSL
ncbi:unnamed protein product [Ilex paraguariensis]|uniref:non-specific serine/threonine protein kinase n=1 Tax=Ilex paraguariensis TaxID=185542 RepID=A0ABC8SFB4_9AQUA